jgi:excisionase family DNA binding protein
MKKHKACKTLDIPTAGKKYFDLGRNAIYRAARRGEIPTVKIGGKRRVPIVALERLLLSAGQQDAA